MHTLMFLAPGHFHGALTLRQRHPLVRDEVFVYAAEEAEVREFLDLVTSFNARPERPTGWRPVLRVGGDPLERLLAERPGDLVILAGRNDRKMGWIRRLHDGGLPVLADKPWMTGSDGLADLRQALAGPPLAMEMMTGRHEITTAIERMLAWTPDVFGAFSSEPGESGHHLRERPPSREARERRPAPAPALVLRRPRAGRRARGHPDAPGGPRPAARGRPAGRWRHRREEPGARAGRRAVLAHPGSARGLRAGDRAPRLPGGPRRAGQRRGPGVLRQR